ncbi:hypothetical protein [Ornithinibacillus sp. JPR2-1]|uniref:hypothetical protein n=1 Tax=Ornithinibacillus sp. JPR2-1 TaxID=2094019 RepID=UPI0031D0D59E
MAFGLNREELIEWKRKVENGEIAILTHYWLDDRFPGCTSVTKVGCKDVEKLIEWGNQYHLNPNYIHLDERYPHFDLFGQRQKEVLIQEGKWDHITKFDL